MEEIKSIRLRDKDGIDIKITLYKDGDKRKIEGKSSGITTFGLSEYGGTRYNNYTDDEIILDFIEVNRKSRLKFYSYYEIVQDPWEEKPPIFRKFGFDPYYLNNGSKAYITWTVEEIDDNINTTTITDIQIGGTEWSDAEGGELQIERGLTQSTKSFITKSITINPPSESGDSPLVIKDSSIRTKEFSDRFTGTITDIDILNQFISLWKIKVPNYNLELCNPNNEFCNIIEYKSPLGEFKEDPLDPIQNEESTQGKETKVKLSVVLPEILDIKVKQDLNGLKVYVGEPPTNSGFIFQDEFDNLEDLDPEFTEDAFSGFEETSVFESQEYDNESDRIQSEEQSERLNSQPYRPSGKHKLDMIPGLYKGNPVKGKPIEVQLCQIHKKPVNVKIADALLDMIEDAKKEGVNIKVTSGFRPAFFPNLNAKSESGIKVEAQSQEELYNQNCKNGKCSPDTAKAGTSKHGSGIAVDFNTGSRGKSFNPLNTKVYVWLVKNSWKYGFVRTVKSEEWHYEYYPDIAKSNGPYAKLPKSNQLFYSDLGLNNLRIT
jgi:hypothetical protein